MVKLIEAIAECWNHGPQIQETGKKFINSIPNRVKMILNRRDHIRHQKLFLNKFVLLLRKVKKCDFFHISTGDLINLHKGSNE